jgi:outer membrane lipoprotein SlyB
MKTLLLVVLAAALGLTACAGVGPQDYSRSEARVIQTVAYGTVESVRAVRLTEDKPIVGTVAGAALGGLLGNSIGHGGGRAAATVIGAVGGGIAGNAIERHATAQDGQEIVIRLESGAAIAIVQGGTQGFEAGQRVRVLTGPKGSRVEPA